MPMPMNNPPQNHSHRLRHEDATSRTLPSLPTRSNLSSDFEFTVVLSTCKSTSTLCPADELFYKGQLLPLQLSPRISMVRTLLLSLPSSSSSSSRDSTGSSTDSLLLDSPFCDSSRPSSVTADQNDLAKLPDDPNNKISNRGGAHHYRQGKCRAKNGYVVLSKVSSVFLCKDIKQEQCWEAAVLGPVKRMSTTAKEVIGKYLKKVKPIYEKLSSQKQQKGAVSRAEGTMKETVLDAESTGKTVRSIVNPFSHSFSGSLRYPRKRSCTTSCPSSMHSSPSHSEVVFGSLPGFSIVSSSDVSSKEELQNAIEGAIAHCKNSCRKTESIMAVL